jgi:histidinol-phosphate/aromatic aminotransferase/cobyric acid decarboxylase-like protein
MVQKHSRQQRSKAGPISDAAFHGGKSFEAIGANFQNLDRADAIINADVLDAWFDPSPRVLEKLRSFLPFLIRTSPPVDAAGLKSALAHWRNISQDCILTGGGSSDLIFTCLPRLCSDCARAMILDPMYGDYLHVLENVLGVETIRFNLHAADDFRISTDELIDSVLANKPDLVVIVNPNSPTGQHCPSCELIRFLNAAPRSTRVIVDETYIDYIGRGESIETECRNHPNLIVLKSMSKVYALSGARVGYLVAAIPVVRELAKWMPPWSTSLPAQVAAVEALKDEDYYRLRYQETHILRQELTCALRRHPDLHVYPSKTNFVLVEVPVSASNRRAYAATRRLRSQV